MLFTHIVAARPNFIKAMPVIKELENKNQTNYIIHTNQHYDYNMSKVFFDELDIPEPNIHLGIGSGSHAKQTGLAMIEIEKTLIDVKPDYLVVYGDVNSSLAGALAASKINIPIIHIESGCRSFDNTMPEEINRILIDNLSDILVCPYYESQAILKQSGLGDGNSVVAGNTAIDTLYKINIKEPDLYRDYYLATLHRPFNVDNPDILKSILTKLNKFSKPVLIPTHPRLKKTIDLLKSKFSNIEFIEPLGYVDFISTLKHSSGVVSDSGGIQSEACFFDVPILTLRPSTEHTPTLYYGNMLIDVKGIKEKNFQIGNFEKHILWDGKASERSVDFILNYSGN